MVSAHASLVGYLLQDGPGAWCQLSRMQLRPGVPEFEHCLNSGTILVRRSPEALAFLEDWWSLADAPPGTRANPFEYDTRLAWPHDQGPLHVAKERAQGLWSSSSEKQEARSSTVLGGRDHLAVAVVPHPHRQFMNWPVRPGVNMKGEFHLGLPIMPYCLSHGASKLNLIFVKHITIQLYRLCLLCELLSSSCCWMLDRSPLHGS